MSVEVEGAVVEGFVPPKEPVEELVDGFDVDMEGEDFAPPKLPLLVAARPIPQLTRSNTSTSVSTSNFLIVIYLPHSEL